MSVIKSKFFNYRDFIVSAIEFLAERNPNDAPHMVCNSRQYALYEYRTVRVNLGRQTGKTHALVNLANELSTQGGAAIVSINSANARWVKQLVGPKDVTVTTVSHLMAMDDLKVKFLIVDESNFALDTMKKCLDLYDWAAKHGVEFVIMT